MSLFPGCWCFKQARFLLFFISHAFSDSRFSPCQGFLSAFSFLMQRYINICYMPCVQMHVFMCNEDITSINSLYASCNLELVYTIVHIKVSVLNLFYYFIYVAPIRIIYICYLHSYMLVAFTIFLVYYHCVLVCASVHPSIIMSLDIWSLS